MGGQVGTLLYHVASRTKPQVWGLVPLLVTYIVEGKVDTEQRLTAALDFLLKMKPGAVVADVVREDLEEAAGVGVVVTAEQVEAAVEEALGSVREEVVQARYRYNTGPLMAAVRSRLRWADGKAVKAEFDIQLLDLLGPKTDQDLAPPPKNDKKKGEVKCLKQSHRIKCCSQLSPVNVGAIRL